MPAPRSFRVHVAGALVVVVVSALVSGCSSAEKVDRPDKLLRDEVQAWEDCKTRSCDTTSSLSFKIEDVDEQRHRFERLAQTYPNHVPTLVANGVVAYDAHLPERAQEYLDRALALQPVHPEAAILRARIASEEGDLPLARKLLEEQIRCTPDHPGLREALAGVLYDLGRLDQARFELDAARGLGAPPWRIDFNSGLIEEAAGRLPEAERLYASAAQANPDYTAAQSRLNALRALRALRSPAK